MLQRFLIYTGILLVILYLPFVDGCSEKNELNNINTNKSISAIILEHGNTNTVFSGYDLLTWFCWIEFKSDILSDTTFFSLILFQISFLITFFNPLVLNVKKKYKLMVKISFLNLLLYFLFALSTFFNFKISKLTDIKAGMYIYLFYIVFWIWKFSKSNRHSLYSNKSA